MTLENHGEKAGTCLVANESREMEVCTFVMVVQQILAELVHLGADIWHDDFETRSGNEQSRSVVTIVVFKGHFLISRKHLSKIKTWSQLFNWIALSLTGINHYPVDKYYQILLSYTVDIKCLSGNLSMDN